MMDGEWRMEKAEGRREEKDEKGRMGIGKREKGEGRK